MWKEENDQIQEELRNVINLQDEYGSEVPLHYALRNNWFDDVGLVLALGANIGIANDEKEV